jgi:hypothetical protein
MIRTPDGYLGVPPQPMNPADWPAMHTAVYRTLDERGFLDRALSILRDAGLRAWRNPLDHIAVDPAGLPGFGS